MRISTHVSRSTFSAMISSISPVLLRPRWYARRLLLPAVPIGWGPLEHAVVACADRGAMTILPPGRSRFPSGGVLSGRAFRAREAASLGLVGEVVEGEGMVRARVGLADRRGG